MWKVAGVWVVILVFLLAGVAAAGNLGEQAETGTITGKVVNTSFDYVEDAKVSAVLDGQVVAETHTDAQGEYTIDDLEPGTYNVTVSHVDYKEVSRQVPVNANEITEIHFQLEPRQQPWTATFSFDGHMLLGTEGAIGPTLTCCSAAPGHEINFTFPVDPVWLETIVVEIVWDDDQTAMRSDLWLNPNCDPACDPDHEYASESGYGEIRYRVDNPQGEWPALSQEEEELSLYQWPENDGHLAVAVLLQDFTIHVEAYYVEPAPEDRL